MGWGTSFTCELYISREHFTSKYEVSDAIEKCKVRLAELKGQLKMLAIAQPKDLILKDCEDRELDIVDSTSSRVNEICQEMEDLIIDQWRYELLYDNWEQKEDE